ncbi:hypothetical protein AB0M87_02570 [Streptomyces sp. NPDC051320]|uniref:hypothetical protein n=1 Tax=Streptomyces sp. NPDC051320 TaxID=3154644 RepID=UPI00341FB963
MSDTTQPVYGAAAEELRKDLTPTADVRTLLVTIADKLTGHDPAGPMLELTRLALAIVFTQRHHRDMDQAAATERQLLAAAPRIERDITRGEYALILRKIAAGGEV